MIEQRFKIGDQYDTRGRSPRRCTIVDVWRTYNSAGELVRLRYVSTHQFMGQALVDHDVVSATVALGLVKAAEKAK